MRKDNVKNQPVLNQEQSLQVATLLKDFFYFISNDEIDEMLKELLQCYIDQEQSPTIAEISDRNFSIGQLSKLLKELSNVSTDVKIESVTNDVSREIKPSRSYSFPKKNYLLHKIPIQWTMANQCP